VLRALGAIILCGAQIDVRADEHASESGWITDEWLMPVVQRFEDEEITEIADPQILSGELLRQPEFIEYESEYDAVATSFLQPQAPLGPPQFSLAPTPLPPAAQSARASMFGILGATSGLVTGLGPSADVVFRPESQSRVTTDIGNLLFKSPSALGVGTQRRNPIVSDPRVRASRVGALSASGSYWLPARIDLDTMLSKIDSRIVEETVVIKGPYSALYGPDFRFIDTQLLPAPRYFDEFETHGSSSFDFKANGENWYGRESIWGGDSDWGFRVGYGHRSGNDYFSGNGTQIPSSFKSRDWDVALGADLTRWSHVDFHYLRLDQTDVELPGQAFDIDFLVTDGYEVTYESEQQRYFDQVEVHSWYNRTRFEGSAQRPGKRAQFPFYDSINFIGFTDVDSMSVGYQAMGIWESCNGSYLLVGADLRYVKQELNEISSGIGFTDANSPIPRSHSSIPGFLFETSSPVDDPFAVRFGGRLDWVSMNIEDDAAKLAAVTPENLPYSAVVGSDAFDQEDSLALVYVSADHQLTDRSATGISFGFAQRPPNLTERYAAEPFMFLLQNGLNTVTGDPTLDPERLWQLDLRYQYDARRIRTGVAGFVAWAHDYITFENLSVVLAPPFGQPEQVNLKYVNTSFASFVGVEWYGEVDANRWITPFATLKYVEGTDHTRRGDFATRQAERNGMIVVPSTRFYDLPRGFFSGIAGANSEPLPGILPLEARVGVRIHPRRLVRSQREVEFQPYDTDEFYEEPLPEPVPQNEPYAVSQNDAVRAASWQSEAPDAGLSTGSDLGSNSGSYGIPRRRNGRRFDTRNGDIVPESDRWGIELSARIVDNQNRVAASLLETPTPGFTVWDLRTFWRPRQDIIFVGGVENFTDKNYREHLDFHAQNGISVFQPGINGYVGGELQY
jgi:outer membrane receptor protein involved in Fe transport